MRVLIAVTVLVAVVSLVGWWFALYSPARDQQAALEAETTQLLDQEGLLSNQYQQLLALKARAPEIRRSLDRLGQFIPPDPDQDSFLELLELAGDASGVEFTSLSFTDPAPVEGAPPTADPLLVLGSITVVGSTQSTYFQMVDFLRRLEVEVPRAVLVEQVSVTEGEDGFPEIATTFTAQMFALIPAPPVADVPADPNAPAGAATEQPTPGVTPSPTTTAVPVDPGADPAQSGTPPTPGDQLSFSPAPAATAGSPS